MLRRIGQGSYGDVWLARGVTGIHRAVKVVWRERFGNAEPYEREFRGLRGFAEFSLKAEGQMALLHIGRNDAAGFFYYVMELADDARKSGTINPAGYVPLTLKEWKVRRGRVPAPEVITAGVELATALAALHASGLVHRDIKPSNVILVNGKAKLADIGLVSAAHEAHTFIGTMGYVPPEGPGSRAADVYALGRVLYELVTGLDGEEFPKLPTGLEQAPDRKQLFALNEVLLRACAPVDAGRYPDASAMLADLTAIQGGQTVRGRWSGRRTLGVAAALVAIASGAAWYGFRAPGPTVRAVAPGATGKSIAVLPFENMNDDKENAFFADGIHEEILTDLGNIAALHVISRTSVMKYRGTTKSVAEIARELGVEFILEGSVRRVGQKVRVTGQLIRAAVDEHIWAKAYDGDMTDILGLQSQLATAIAGQLEVVLTPAETKRLTAVTLADPKAYELYLRAKDKQRHEQNFEDHSESLALMKQATALDPSFALAWAELAKIHIQNFFSNQGKPEARELAKQAIDKAAALAPDRAEVEAGLGLYFYFGFADFESAARHYQRALALEPSNAEIHKLLGMLARRLGRWREAIDELKKAHELDPLNDGIFEILETTLVFSHRYDEARELFQPRLKASPEVEDLKFFNALLLTCATRTRQPLLDFVAALTPAQRQEPARLGTLVDIAYNMGDPAEVVRLGGTAPLPAVGAPGDGAILDVSAMQLELAVARRVLAQDSVALLAEIRAKLEKQVRANPRELDHWARLEVTAALQGDRTRAESAMKGARDSISENDILNSYDIDLARAKALAWLGDKDASIVLLSRLVHQPGSLYPPEVLWGLDWWPLRGDPRFEAIVADKTTFQPVY